MKNQIKRIICSVTMLLLSAIFGNAICSFYDRGVLRTFDDKANVKTNAEGGYSIEISKEKLDEVSLKVEFVYAEKSNSEKKIDINTAIPDVLMLIDGISSSKAESIVRMRYEIGGFKCIEDLRNIDGISEKTYNKIKDKIYVSKGFNAEKDARIIRLLDKENKVKEFEKAWDELIE